MCRELERVVGHVVLVLLGIRLALSVSRHAYAFIQDYYEKRQRVWGSVAGCGGDGRIGLGPSMRVRAAVLVRDV